MAVLAVLSRRRCLIWAWGFILAGVLPLAFIDGRAGFAYLVPSVGWAVYCAGLVQWLIETLASRRVWLRRAVPAALLTDSWGWPHGSTSGSTCTRARPTPCKIGYGSVFCSAWVRSTR